MIQKLQFLFLKLLCNYFNLWQIFFYIFNTIPFYRAFKVIKCSTLNWIHTLDRALMGRTNRLQYMVRYFCGQAIVRPLLF